MLTDIEIRQEQMSERERQLCDLFLEEYKKDYNPEKACLRLGVEPESLNKALYFFNNSPYVLKQMAEYVVLDKPDNQKSIDKAFKFVVNRLRDVAEAGSNKERLDACKQLSLIYGLNKPIDIRTNNSLTNVILSPSPVTDAEWEEQAGMTMEANYDEGR